MAEPGAGAVFVSPFLQTRSQRRARLTRERSTAEKKDVEGARLVNYLAQMHLLLQRVQVPPAARVYFPALASRVTNPVTVLAFSQLQAPSRCLDYQKRR